MKSRLILENFLPYRLVQLSQTVSTAFFEIYQNEFTLTIPEWRVIALLGQNAPQAALELVISSGMDKVKVSRACDSLANMGFLSRKVDPVDRRKVKLDLTVKGKIAHQKYTELASDWEKKLLQCLSEEEEQQFDQILTIIFNHSAQGKNIKLVNHIQDLPNRHPFILAKFYPYRFAILSKLISDNFAEVYQDRFGLTIPEWRLVAILGQFGPLSAGEVAQHAGLDQVKVSRASARLQKAGLLKRIVNLADRRKVQLSLPPKGKRTHQQISTLALEWEKQLLAILNPQQQTILDPIIDKILQRTQELFEIYLDS